MLFPPAGRTAFDGGRLERLRVLPAMAAIAGEAGKDACEAAAIKNASEGLPRWRGIHAAHAGPSKIAHLRAFADSPPGVSRQPTRAPCLTLRVRRARLASASKPAGSAEAHLARASIVRITVML